METTTIQLEVDGNCCEMPVISDLYQKYSDYARVAKTIIHELDLGNKDSITIIGQEALHLIKPDLFLFFGISFDMKINPIDVDIATEFRSNRTIIGEDFKVKFNRYCDCVVGNLTIKQEEMMIRFHDYTKKKVGFHLNRSKLVIEIDEYHTNMRLQMSMEALCELFSIVKGKQIKCLSFVQDDSDKKMLHVPSSPQECEDTFCYVFDMIEVGINVYGITRKYVEKYEQYRPVVTVIELNGTIIEIDLFELHPTHKILVSEQIQDVKYSHHEVLDEFGF
jgi:hypothetical protein